MACALPPAVVYVPAAGAVFSSKNTPLDFWNMYFVDFVISERFQGPLVKKLEYMDHLFK